MVEPGWETSQQASQPYFVFIIAVCSFVLVFVATTSDDQIKANFVFAETLPLCSAICGQISFHLHFVVFFWCHFQHGVVVRNCCYLSAVTPVASASENIQDYRKLLTIFP